MVSDPNPFNTGMSIEAEPMRRSDGGTRVCDNCGRRTEHVFDHAAGLFLCTECEL